MTDDPASSPKQKVTTFKAQAMLGDSVEDGACRI